MELYFKTGDKIELVPLTYDDLMTVVAFERAGFMEIVGYMRDGVAIMSLTDKGKRFLRV